MCRFHDAVVRDRFARLAQLAPLLCLDYARADLQIRAQSRLGSAYVPTWTLLIVIGSWVVLAVLTLIHYFVWSRDKGEEEE